MKKILFIALIGICSFLWTSQTHAAILLVNVASSSNNAAAVSVSSTLNIATSGLIVVGCRHGTTFVAPTSATDTIGNVFTQFATASNTNSGAITGYYTISSSSNATDIVSCNFASSVAGRGINVLQYSGLASSPLDQTAKNSTTTSVASFSAGPFTTVYSDEVIVAMGSTGATNLAAGAGYGMEVSSVVGSGTSNMGIEDKLVNSIQTNVSSTFTATANTGWMMVVGTFQELDQPISFVDNPLCTIANQSTLTIRSKDMTTIKIH